MHKRIIETALSRLDASRATYFGEVARRLETDSRAQSNANIIYTVLNEVMAELPIYLDKDELIDLLVKFSESNYQRLRQALFDPEFVRDPASIRTVTDEFILQVVDMSFKKGDDGDTSRGVHRLTWPYRETDLVDPEDDPEEWAEALAKSEAWRLQHRLDRRRSGPARIDEVAAEKAREVCAAKKKTSD